MLGSLTGTPADGSLRDVKVITIATDLEHTLLNRLLIPSCRTAGLDLLILHTQREDFEFADKREILTNYLTQVTDLDELLVFTDAYDTLFLRGSDFIKRMYENFLQPVVFSANNNCWPMAVTGFGLYESPPAGRFPYLCSGGFIGPAGDLLDLCLKYPEPPSQEFELLRRLRAHGYDPDNRWGFSDQYHWTLVQLLEPDRVGVDTEGVLFDYYGPRLPEEDMWNLVREEDQAFAHGPESEVYQIPYQRERAQLVTRLTEPSEAAQVHFASGLTKAVMLDLLTEGKLPAWITDACQPAAQTGQPPTVVPA
jgi:hypothetical protein